jgi:hypothetical protein
MNDELDDLTLEKMKMLLTGLSEQNAAVEKRLTTLLAYFAVNEFTVGELVMSAVWTLYLAAYMGKWTPNPQSLLRVAAVGIQATIRLATLTGVHPDPLAPAVEIARRPEVAEKLKNIARQFEELRVEVRGWSAMRG